MERKIFKKKIVLKSTGVEKSVVADTKSTAIKTTGKNSPGKDSQAAPQRVFGLHTLRIPVGAHKKKKLLGRGSSSGHGKTSTRGSKGQTSRAGRDFYPGFEGGQTPLIRRIPKRGFSGRRFRKEFQIINLGQLSKIKDLLITPELLEKKGLIKDKTRLVKILGDGEFKNAVTIQAHAFSKKAQEKIKSAGAKFEVLNA